MNWVIVLNTGCINVVTIVYDVAMVRQHICKEIFVVSVSSCYSSVFVTCSIPIFLLLQLLCLFWVASSIPILLLFFNKMLVLREEICQQICNLVDVYLRYRSFNRLPSFRSLLFYVRYGIVFCSRELALLQFLLNGTYMVLFTMFKCFKRYYQWSFR